MNNGNVPALPANAPAHPYGDDNATADGKFRNWIFVWNNYPADYRLHLDGVNCRYLIAGEELAPTTGTPHLQGFVVFTNAIRQRTVRERFPGCHVLVARASVAQNEQYCRKTRPDDLVANEVVYERGDKPMSSAEKGAMEQARYQNAWDFAKTGDIESIDADIRVRLYSSIRRIEKDYMPDVARLDAPCGIWIYGISGAGKSRAVLDAFPNLYPKPRNNWWDGYQREDVVLLDDVDKFDVALGGKLKHWADCYPFIGENKGGSLKIRPKKFFVTSQYTIEEIWSDQETREALNRRFTCLEKRLGVDLQLVDDEEVESDNESLQL